MEISSRDLWTAFHGIGLVVLFVLAFWGAVAELYRLPAAAPSAIGPGGQSRLKFYLAAMVILAWLTVLTGACVIFPWYRAGPPAGAAGLAHYSGRLNIVMKWKEHIAWLAPIAVTMVAYVTMQYRWGLIQHRNIRNAVLGFTLAAFFATGVAGAFGILLNKLTPVSGGSAIVLKLGE